MKTVDEWNESHIISRADHLARLATGIWKYPDVSDDIMKLYAEAERQQANEYSLVQYEHLTGEILSLFHELRKRILELDE